MNGLPDYGKKIAPYNYCKKVIKKTNFVTITPGSNVNIKDQIFQFVINLDRLDRFSINMDWNLRWSGMDHLLEWTV